MRRKHKRKTNVILIVLLVILLVILIVSVAFVLIRNSFNEIGKSDNGYSNTNASDNGKNNSGEGTTDSQQRPEEYVRLDTVYPMEIEKFFNFYSGNVPREKVLETVTNFIYYFIDNKGDIDSITDDNISEFYNNNKETINNAGMVTEEDFKNIVNAIKMINTKNLEFSYAQIKSNTISNVDGVTSAEFELKYTYYEPIILEIKVANTDDENERTVSFSCKE